MGAPVQTMLMARGAASDPLFSSVKLLLHGNGTNGGTVFTDSSSAARTPTVIGTPTTVTDGAAFGGSSIIFPQNCGLNYTQAGGFLTNAADDYTIEGFLVVTSIGNPNAGYADGDYESLRISLAGARLVALGAETTTKWVTALPGQSALTGTPTSRTHFAITRLSGTVRLWLDGVLTTASSSSSSNFDLVSVGNSNSGGASRTNAGRIEEVRLTAGTARYTSAFSPPSDAFPDS